MSKAALEALTLDYANFEKGVGASLLNIYPAEASATIRRLRASARQKWASLEIPTRQNEAWKYTSPKAFLETNWLPAQSGVPTLSPQDFGKIPFLDTLCAARLVFVNGFFYKSLSKYSATRSLDVFPLSEIWGSGDPQYRSLVDEFIKNAAGHIESETEFFAAFNGSSLREAALVRVGRDAIVDAPVLIIFVSTDKMSPAVPDKSLGRLMGSQPRVAVDAQLGGKVCILEAHVSLGESESATNAFSQIQAGEMSSVVYCRLQNQSLQSIHFGETRIMAARSSRVESYEIALGAAVGRQNLTVSLLGEGAEAIVDGLYLPVGEQHLDHHTTIDHAVSHTTSEQLYKGILNDQARAVFSGRIRIRRDAQKSNSSQLNQNLILDPKAEIDTKPELEIDADDVKAAHGATVGQLDSESLFYLQSRAISRPDAIRILAAGFAQDVIDRIPHPILQKELRGLVEAKLRSHDEAKLGVH